MDIFEALLQSHARQRAHVPSACSTASATPPNASKAFDELKTEMAAHETAEERAFYVPLIEHDETVDPARHGIAEHHEMDEMVEDLEKAEEGSAEWLEDVGKLVHKVHHHLDEEEQKFFPQARKVLRRAAAAGAGRAVPAASTTGCTRRKSRRSERARHVMVSLRADPQCHFREGGNPRRPPLPRGRRTEKALGPRLRGDDASHRCLRADARAVAACRVKPGMTPSGCAMPR